MTRTKYEAMTSKLNAADLIANTSARDHAVAVESARALVSIAETLGALLEALTVETITTAIDGLGANAAKWPAGDDYVGEQAPYFEPPVDEPATEPRPLAVDDEVRLPGVELVTATIASITESEGALVAVLRWPDGLTTKSWLTDLTRVGNDDDPVADAFVPPPAPTRAELENMPADAFAALRNKGGKRAPMYGGRDEDGL